MENNQLNITLDEKRRALKWVAILIVAITFFVAVQTVNSFKTFYHIGEDPSARETITVSGEGEVFAVPDVATFTFGVEAEASSVSEAQAQVSKVVNSAIEMLEDRDIEERDVQTSNYSVYPRYEFRQSATSLRGSSGERVLVGYVVNQSTSVKVRDVESAGEVLGELANLEVNNVSGLQLTIDDPEELERSARTEAIRDAKGEAHRLARDLGVRIGKVVGFNESGGGFPPMYESRMSMGGAVSEDAAVANISVGENRIRANVSITYEIK